MISFVGWAMPTSQTYAEKAFGTPIEFQANLTLSRLNTRILNLQTWDFAVIHYLLQFLGDRLECQSAYLQIGDRLETFPQTASRDVLDAGNQSST
jgi:hypothetical protein